MIERRSFLTGSATSLVALLLGSPEPAGPRELAVIKAIAFDGFTVFDPRPIATLAEQLFHGRGEPLVGAWRTRQFEYTWLRTLMGRYANFWQVTEEALVFAASALKLDLTVDRRHRLMQAYLEIKAWSDARPALESCYQPQDRQGAGPHDPAATAGSG